MKTLSNLGRWMFLPSFLLYVALHFGLPEVGASLVPSFLPAPLAWNYATGACVAAFILAGVAGRYDRLASLLMALYVALMIFLVHIQRAAESQNDQLNIFRNVMVVGALLMYAGAYARDRWLPGRREAAGTPVRAT
jgi:hypothetical protein